ncbi:unnamed protein product [Durusdinium trenchii]|uniref:Uncharacterized protein n=1 Tax=Durusdinium trenchii TaxID=1381693 RepID=A0ABP0HK45_9DINO
MPPPRPESQEPEEDSSEETSSSEAEQEQPPPIASAEAAASRAAALAEQLAARTAITAIAKAPAPSPGREARNNGSASPFARPRETGPSVEVEPLILEAEPQDLVVIGNAANCGAWIGKAITESQFVAVVKTPVAPSTSVIVDARLAEEANIKPELLQRRWMALRVRRPTGDPRLPLRELSALCDQLVQAGVEPRTLVPIDSRSYLLMSREHVHVSVTALVQCGHLVSPARRVVTAMQLPDASPELPEPQVGAWKLTQRHSPNITKDFTGGDLFQSTLRVQAKCGLYAEVRAADRSEVSSAFHAQQSSFGTLRLGGDAGAWRDSIVEFQPSKGSPPASLRFTMQCDDKELKEETVPAQGSQGVTEIWSKIPLSERVTALELDSDTANGRAGIWMFAGNLFLRIIGVPRTESLLGSHCCRSLSQLEYFHGIDAVQNELRKFEVLVGEVEQPGVLRAHRCTWQDDAVPNPIGQFLLDARPNAESGGSAEVQLENGCVLHQDPDGKQLRWRIHEWGPDPFTVPEPSVESEPEPAQDAQQASESESESVRKKKDIKAASKGAAPKGKAKAQAQSAKKEEKDSDEETEEKTEEKKEKEHKKKKHKKDKNKEKDKEKDDEKDRKRGSSRSRSSSEVKKKKKERQVTRSQ